MDVSTIGKLGGDQLQPLPRPTKKWVNFGPLSTKHFDPPKVNFLEEPVKRDEDNIVKRKSAKTILENIVGDFWCKARKKLTSAKIIL